MSKTTIALIVLNIVFDFIIQAIIVERNLHSYYRIPTTTIKTSNTNKEFYILQCPFKTSLNIPHPKDMPVCVIVGTYNGNENKQKEMMVKAKPRSILNTQVNYRCLKPPIKLVKVVKMKAGKPYTMIPKTKDNYKIPKIEIKEPYKSTTVKLVIQNPKEGMNQSNIVYSIPIVHKIHANNDSIALSSTNEPRNLTQMLKSADQDADFIDDPIDEEDTQYGPLKYLGSQDIVKQLKLRQAPPHASATNQTLYKSEKFFADLNNFEKGYRTKGYQNMYHRDEIYQDHIFYDDLQQMGNYRIHKKYREHQPQ